jgi:hypothetical protein
MHRSRSPSPTSGSPRHSRHTAGTTQTHPPPVVNTAQGPQPEAAPADDTQETIDQPLPNTHPDSRALVSVTPSQGLVLSTPVPKRSLEPVEGFNAAALEGLLATWPQPQPYTLATPTHCATPSQQTVATAAVQDPFLFEQLPLDLQQLVLGMVLGNIEHVLEEPYVVWQPAAQLRCTYRDLLVVNKPLHQLTTQHFRERVLLCTLRIPPTSVSQVLALPIHHLLGMNPQQIAPITVLERLTQALCSLPTDEQACHAALTLGRQLLQALCRPGIMPATQRALLCMPQLIVRALRARLRNKCGNAYAITCTLKDLMHWSVAHGPSLALPLLLELLLTLAQLEKGRQQEILASAEVSLHTDDADSAVVEVCAQAIMPMALISSIYLLADVLHNPWETRVQEPPADHASTPP